MRDLVCGMPINAARAAASRTVGGEELFFCSDLCLERFEARRDPSGPRS